MSTIDEVVGESNKDVKPVLFEALGEESKKDVIPIQRRIKTKEEIRVIQKKIAVLQTMELKISPLRNKMIPDLNTLPDSLYFAVPHLIFVHNLMERIHGVTQIEVERIQVLYCGSFLDPEDLVPEDAYEPSTEVSEDAFIFRPRLFMTLRPVRRQLGTPKKSMRSKKKTGEDPDHELKAMQQRLASQRQAMFQELKSMKAEVIDSNEFSLEESLSKIRCSLYFQMLKDAGYSDEGSFSSLTEEFLVQNFVPKKSRARILALAENVKRQLQILRKDKTATREVETELLEKKIISTVTLEGHESEYFATRKELKDYWIQKQRDEEQRKKDEADAAKRRIRVARSHNEETNALIARIKWRCTADDLGVPTEYRLPTVPKFCCEKHEKEALTLREQFIADRRAANSNDLQVSIRRLDSFRNGCLSRNTLRVLAEEQLKKSHYEADAEPLEVLLDSCVMSSLQQVSRRDWGAPSERAGASIPSALYDSQRFVTRVVDWLEQLDRTRVI